jgi:putative glutamine amidotransferase
MLLLVPMSAKEKARGAESPYLAGLRAGSAAPDELLPLAPGEPLPPHFDGLLLTGGADVEPGRYGETARASNLKTDPTRDAMDFPLLQQALERRAPIFAICRGLQVLNVVLGGTLYQDLVEDRATAHPHRSQIRTERLHEVTVQTHGLLAVLVPPALPVNSLHHQAVRRPSPRLVVTARSTVDGIVEALEPAFPYPWLLAVQWHPEELLDDPLQRSLFAAFVAGTRTAIS